MVAATPGQSHLRPTAGAPSLQRKLESRILPWIPAYAGKTSLTTPTRTTLGSTVGRLYLAKMQSPWAPHRMASQGARGAGEAALPEGTVAASLRVCCPGGCSAGSEFFGFSGSNGGLVARRDWVRTNAHRRASVKVLGQTEKRLVATSAKSPHPPFEKGGQESPPFAKGDLGGFPDTTRATSKNLTGTRRHQPRSNAGNRNQAKADPAGRFLLNLATIFSVMLPEDKARITT